MHPAAHRLRLYSPKSIVALSQRVTLVTVFLVTQRTENLQTLRRFTKCLERDWLANLCFFFRVAKWLKPEISFGWLVKNRHYTHQLGVVLRVFSDRNLAYCHPQELEGPWVHSLPL